jgi:hypothetical protein
VKESEIVLSLALPAGADSAKPFEPSDQPLNNPTTPISSKGSAILLATAGASPSSTGSDEFNTAFTEQLGLKARAVPRLVTDQRSRENIDESGVERVIGEGNIVTVSAVDGHSQWETVPIGQYHELCCLAGAGHTHAFSTVFGLDVRPIDVGLQPRFCAGGLQSTPERAKDEHEYALPDPLAETAVACLVGWIPCR